MFSADRIRSWASDGWPGVKLAADLPTRYTAGNAEQAELELEASAQKEDRSHPTIRIWRRTWPRLYHIEEQFRGAIQDILILCGDDLTGLPEAVVSAFPATDVQLCVVHQVRNATKFVSYKDRKTFCASMRPLYTAPTIEAAELALDQFKQCYESLNPAEMKRRIERLRDQLFDLVESQPEVPVQGPLLARAQHSCLHHPLIRSLRLFINPMLFAAHAQFLFQLHPG